MVLSHLFAWIRFLYGSVKVCMHFTNGSQLSVFSKGLQNMQYSKSV